MLFSSILTDLYSGPLPIPVALGKHAEIKPFYLIQVGVAFHLLVEISYSMSFSGNFLSSDILLRSTEKHSHLRLFINLHYLTQNDMNLIVFVKIWKDHIKSLSLSASSKVVSP